MLEVYDQRLKNIEDKINEIVFALESNEIRMKIPISPIQFKEDEVEEPEEKRTTLEKDKEDLAQDDDDEDEIEEEKYIEDKGITEEETHDVEEDD
jgi:hypothetical protein